MELEEIQRLSTSGARGVELFHMNGSQYLAIPQLAEDDLSKPANMNGGNSDTKVWIYQWDESQFNPIQSIEGHGCEDVHFTYLDQRPVIAIANIRSGHDPDFNMHTESTVYEWSGNQFSLLQTLPSFAAKGCHFFQAEQADYLLVSEGVSLDASEVNANNSHLYRWNGQRFESHQSLPGLWGYDIDHAIVNGRLFVSLADNIAASVIYEWHNQQLVPFQSFATEGGGRHIQFFNIKAIPYIAVSNLLHDSEIYVWDQNRYVLVQTLPGQGCRNMHLFEANGSLFLVRINFITGTREQPITKQQATIYQWQGDIFEEHTHFITHGGTACQSFKSDNDTYLVVSNSLSESIRFRVDSVVYKLHF